MQHTTRDIIFTESRAAQQTDGEEKCLVVTVVVVCGLLGAHRSAYVPIPRQSYFSWWFNF